MGKSRIMYDMTLKEVREGLKEMKTVIVPVGVVEQHGYHLPLSVDILNAVEMASRVSDICGCFVAPPLNYCFSGGTLSGTINLSPQVFSLVIMDICRSLISQGFKNVVILLGHGGTENMKAAYDALENFQRLSPEIEDITLSLIPFWEFSPTFMQALPEGDFHAGKYETSLMLYWKLELVRMDQAELDNPELVARMRQDQDAYQHKHKNFDSKYVVPRITQVPEMEVGVMGNFEGANAALGKQIVEEAATAVAELVGSLEARLHS